MNDALEQVRAKGCDIPNPPVYVDPRGGYTCRCIVCDRCGKHTGNSNQGHYWRFCSARKAMADEWHYCCPDDCALEEK